jgi:hypothetical protein
MFIVALTGAEKKICREIKKFIRLSLMLIGGMEGTYGVLIRSE